MPRLRMTLAYDGAAFAGSQIQPGQRTVQGVVESALTTLDGRPVRAVFAGRTDTGGNALGFTIEGNGFLPHMVRNLVGTLMVIGARDAPVTWIEALLGGRDRRLAAPTAPPHALCLWRVRYDGWDGERATEAAHAGRM